MKKLYLYSILVLAVVISFIFDKNISIFFTSYRISILSSLAIFIDFVAWYVLFSIILMVIILSKNYKKILPLILSLFLYLILTNGLKIIISRERPFVELQNELVQTLNPDRSFPSGHATAMFTVLNFMDKMKYLWIFFGIIVILSRVYLGVHYLSDVIFGMLLGLLIGDLTNYIVKNYKLLNKFKLS
ncbi:MAG: phosphatase PAP2 family protein [Nanoarchaeota archaeon]